jgi:uncharacterized phage protein (TIGR02218 family)
LTDSSTILRYCSGDADINYNGIQYPATGTYGSNAGAGGPYFDRSGNKSLITQSIGTNVDTLTFDVIPGNALVNGQAFLKACHDGVFDGATLRLWRAYMPTYGDTTAGAILRFQGLVAQVDAGRSYATFIINSWLDLLNQPMPRNVYSAGCRFNLGDSSCGVNLNLYAVAGTCAAGTSNSTIIANIAASNIGYFDQGKIEITSGALAGLRRTVKQVSLGTPGTITLLGALPSAPATNDTFIIYPGCDKTFSGANGCAKFNNQTRFGGEPLIPIPSQTM